jgi:hypothetical protein
MCEHCKREDAVAATEEEHRLKGWECPVCGAGVSPYVTSCPCKEVSQPVCDPQYMPVYSNTRDDFPQRYIVTCGGHSNTVYGKSSCGL